MKVLQVLPALNSGGVERGTLEMGTALVKAGHESWVISGGGQLVSRLERQGSTHVQWSLGKKSPLSLLQVPGLRRWLTRQRFDIVHLRSRMPAWLVWLAWRGMPAATRPHLVTTVHGLHSVSRYSAIVTCGERVIVVSESVRRYVTENYPDCDPAKLRLVYRGINPAQFPPGYRPPEHWLRRWYRQYPQLLEHDVITLPGRLTRLKNHTDFLRILAGLRARGRSVKGLIVGDEDPGHRAYAQEIHDLAMDMGLSDHVLFTGHRNDMREIYAMSSVVLSLSNRPESFGRTVLEPLSMQVPVVAYNHGGVGEIMQALFPEGAVPCGAIEEAVEKVDAALRQALPPPRANTTFLLSRMCEDTLAVYRELLETQRDRTEH
ncbi:glycosyltransferase family 4 protein [Chromatocurvus halotolerans]|uniref:Glycosyltransferase involved in cell wall biosynthesis n=1 Tax=Chromatocurvus halotolerans TaxID=1132028 RepID=A0A4R2KXE6_9GAMM|nr:glycosyltransferase family 4 protein [Chromatocurvus halotolerans]TCO77557.1 glycosyltransferase involved in cell wall biosynthesis [Chromatocurvus halotolerans]